MEGGYGGGRFGEGAAAEEDVVGGRGEEEGFGGFEADALVYACVGVSDDVMVSCPVEEIRLWNGLPVMRTIV